MAFTLIEIMVSVSILLVVLAAIFMVLSTGRNTWWSSTVSAEVHQEVRKAEEWISKELRQGIRTSINIPVSEDSIAFRVPSNVSNGGVITPSQVITYYLGGLNNSQLLRSVGGNINVLANNIQPPVFHQDLDDPQIIEVTITANKNDYRGRSISATLDFKVKLRN